MYPLHCVGLSSGGGVTMGTIRTDLPLLEQSGLQKRGVEITSRLNGFVLGTHTRRTPMITHFMHCGVDCGRQSLFSKPGKRFAYVGFCKGTHSIAHRVHCNGTRIMPSLKQHSAVANNPKILKANQIKK